MQDSLFLSKKEKIVKELRNLLDHVSDVKTDGIYVKNKIPDSQYSSFYINNIPVEVSDEDKRDIVIGCMAYLAVFSIYSKYETTKIDEAVSAVKQELMKYESRMDDVYDLLIAQAKSDGSYYRSTYGSGLHGIQHKIQGSAFTAKFVYQPTQDKFNGFGQYRDLLLLYSQMIYRMDESRIGESTVLPLDSSNGICIFGNKPIKTDSAFIQVSCKCEDICDQRCYGCPRFVMGDVSITYGCRIDNLYLRNLPKDGKTLRLIGLHITGNVMISYDSYTRETNIMTLDTSNIDLMNSSDIVKDLTSNSSKFKKLDPNLIHSIANVVSDEIVKSTVDGLFVDILHDVDAIAISTENDINKLHLADDNYSKIFAKICELISLKFAHTKTMIYTVPTEYRRFNLGNNNLAKRNSDLLKNLYLSCFYHREFMSPREG